MHALGFISIIFIIAAIASPSWVESAINSSCDNPFSDERQAVRNAMFRSSASERNLVADWDAADNLALQEEPQHKLGLVGEIQQIDFGLGVAQYSKSQITVFKGTHSNRTVEGVCLYDIDDGVFELNALIDVHNAVSKKSKWPDFSKDDLDTGGKLLVAALVFMFLAVVISPMQWIGWLPYHAAWAIRALVPLSAILTISAPILIATGRTLPALCDLMGEAGDDCVLHCRHGGAFACALVAAIILSGTSVGTWLSMPVGSTDVAYDHPSYATLDKDADGLGTTAVGAYGKPANGAALAPTRYGTGGDDDEAV